MERITNMVAEHPVVIFSKTSCCMCHSIKSLFYDLGVNPTVYELDEIENGRGVEAVLARLGRNAAVPVPAVYIGGEFEGGAREILILHLDRLLKPKLVNVGALEI